MAIRARSRSRVSVEIENYDAVMRRLAEGGSFLLGNPMEDMYKELGGKVLKKVEQTTAQMAHRTGDLAGAYTPFKLWNYTDIPRGGQIDNPIFYGRFVDAGTKFIKPRKFQRKAVTQSRSEADSSLRKLAISVESKWRI